ncbi:T9SS type B sorting domain-containing protein [Solitalea koreensis]|uniref:Conserved repeat domain-containing protein/gliding motility-associated C-terminal domain-containing protein n=1 Tax=Solitalea koreensis TaxID=543615 RepID=A0A521CG61_9SPHI|nr:gliding motility-associated C-terminal domain-containing protein [Solitalea koreensis]SMO58424.1 conserved repeat domain-containing protein/gliding motility-associated C-terminal domain-containing protein [Solitalea koreensis]
MRNTNNIANTKTIGGSKLILAVLLLLFAGYSSFGQCPIIIKVPPSAKVSLSQSKVCPGQTVNLVVQLTSDDESLVSVPQWVFTYSQDGVNVSAINTAGSLPAGASISRTGKDATVVIPLTITIPGTYTYGISSLSDNWYPANTPINACNYSSTTNLVINSVMSIASCSPTNVSCFGSTDGSISAGEVSNASGPVSYVWKNSSNAVIGNTATVNNLMAGTYTLTVTDGCTTLSCSQTITEPNPIAASISGTTTICMGETAPISFVGPSNGLINYTVNGISQSVRLDNRGMATVITPALTANSTYALSSVSSDPAGAKVCSNAVSGHATITVVSPPVVASIIGPSIVNVGATVTLTNAIPGGVWSSSDPSLATVSASGMVKGVKPGDVDIFYTVTNECGSVTGTKKIAIRVLDINPLGVNTPPSVAAIERTTQENMPVIEDVLSKVSDKENNVNPNSLSIVQAPTNGVAALTFDNKIQYTPNAGFYGQDKLKFVVCDTKGACTEQYITINVLRIQADLSVLKISQGENIQMNQEFEYLIKAINHGSNDATKVLVKDVLPASLEFVSALSTRGSFTYDQLIKTLTWDIGDLKVYGQEVITIKVRSKTGGTVTNTATISGVEYDANLTNNSSTDSRYIYGLSIPTAFTPNGDNVNDYFVIPGIEEVQNSIFIYNRWGDEVYRKNNYQNNWNGSSLPSGTYYYVLKVKDKDNKWDGYSGYIEIIR